MEIILPAAAALLAALLTWLFCKLWYGKNYRPLSNLVEIETSYTQLETTYQQVVTDLAIQNNRLQQLTTDHALQKQQIEIKWLENTDLNNIKSRQKALLEAADTTVQRLQLETEMAKINLQQSVELLQQAKQQLAQLQSHKQFLEEKLATQQTELANMGLQLKTEFKALADEVLQTKADSFNATQETKLKDLIDPLRTRIQEFKADMETKFGQASTERTSLQEQVKLMAQLNRELSQQADNLTKALTSQVKQQGNWGEEILETILQYVGLQKGIHYTVQQTASNFEGQTIRPDFIVRYPDSRYVVIDSKVSLIHYRNFVESNTPQAQQQQLTLLTNSIRSHINGLAAKRYHDIAGTLDYVFLFVPVEGALITALQTDLQLWQHAFDKNILLVSPTLLITGMKLVHELWKQDDVNQNAAQMAERAGALYDKLAGFVDSFEDVGKKLETANTSFARAKNQLSSGRGNALKQADDMKKMGAKTNKQIGVEWDENTL